MKSPVSNQTTLVPLSRCIPSSHRRPNLNPNAVRAFDLFDLDHVFGHGAVLTGLAPHLKELQIRVETR